MTRATGALRLLPLLAVIAALAACQPASTVEVHPGAVPAPQVNVEVDAFSGVPNPSWQLSSADATKLAGLVATLQAAGPQVQPVDPGLGFRGFLVRGLDLGALGSYDTLRVQGEIVVASKGPSTDSEAVYTDSGHEMYTLLRSAAIDGAHVPAALETAIPAEGLATGG